MREVWLKYRAAMLERNPNVQLLRIEAYNALQQRLNQVEEDSLERRQLDNAISILDQLRRANLKPQPESESSVFPN